MDPVSQVFLGAAAAQAAPAVLKKSGIAKLKGKIHWTDALIFGGLGGAFPDIDVLFQTGNDLLGHGDLHRHFTHSLAFIPLGGLLTLLPFLLFKRFRERWKSLVFFATVGCATHALLDCCTSYGTLWLWPFSMKRISWDIVSIIDPLYTIPLIIGVLWATRTGKSRPSQIALLISTAYLCFGIFQHNRAISIQKQIAESRGHIRERGRTLPSIANLMIWRSIYETNGILYTDGILTPYFGSSKILPGTAVSKLTESQVAALAESGDFPSLLKDFRFFSDFSDHYVALVPQNESIIGDMRYAMRPETPSPLWGLEIRLENRNRPLVWIELARKNPHESTKAIRRFLDTSQYIPVDHFLQN